jgi:hypothetical protein
VHDGKGCGTNSLHQYMHLMHSRQRTPTPAAARPSVICRVQKLAFLLPLLLNEPLLLKSTMMTLSLCLLSVKQAQAELSTLTTPARGATSKPGTVGMPA